MGKKFASRHLTPSALAAARLKPPKFSFLRAEGHGLSLEKTNPTFTNLSAVLNQTNRAEGWRHTQMKGGHHGSQLRKTVQPPRYPSVPLDPGLNPGHSHPIV